MRTLFLFITYLIGILIYIPFMLVCWLIGGVVWVIYALTELWRYAKNPQRSPIWVVLVVCLLLLSGCATCKERYYKTLLEATNNIYCQDSVLIGFTSAYLGKEEWKKLNEAFEKAIQKSPYGSGCGQYNGHWLGHRIYTLSKGND